MMMMMMMMIIIIIIIIKIITIIIQNFIKRHMKITQVFQSAKNYSVVSIKR